MTTDEAAYRAGEANREMDIIIAVEHSESWDDLLKRLREITGCPDLELGSEYGGEDGVTDTPADRCER